MRDRNSFARVIIRVTFSLAMSGCAPTVPTVRTDSDESPAVYISRPRRLVSGGVSGDGIGIIAGYGDTTPDWRETPPFTVTIGSPPRGCPKSRVWHIHNANCGEYQVEVEVDGNVLATPYTIQPQEGEPVFVLRHPEEAYYCMPHPEEVHTVRLTGFRPDESGTAERVGEWASRFRPAIFDHHNTGAVITCP